MTTAIRTPVTKPSKAQLAQQEFAKLLASSSKRGFHGTAGITLSIQDGHIQHLKVNVERMIR